MYNVPSDTLRGTVGLFQPNPNPGWERKERGRFKQQFIGMGKNTTNRACEDSWALSCLMPMSPAPKPDSCGHACTPESPPLAQKPLKERERKNKKDVVPDAHR